MRKRNLLLAMLVMTTVSLCACGSEAETTEKNTTTKVIEQQSNSKTEDTTKEQVTTKQITTKEPTTEEITSNIRPVKEEDAVIYIDDVAIKMDQTYEEFEKLMKQNNWTVSSIYESAVIPTDEKRSGKFCVATNVGEFLIRFMANENNTDSVIRNITIYPNYITTDNMEKINICGITLDTTHEEIKGKLELYSEAPTGNVYLLDDWLYISVWDTTSEGTSTLQIDRKIFTQRETE